MSILVVGSVAYDTVTTPFGKVQDALGGSATYFSASASFFSPVKIVAVVGRDFDGTQLDFLRARGVDTSGLTVADGDTFRWSGSYGAEMGDAQTLARTSARRSRSRTATRTSSSWPTSTRSCSWGCWNR
jgi:sugar/nucleoside kinase (ribokinase family)